jgi:hypothetical protein
MHKMRYKDQTLCGRDMEGWSRTYLNPTQAASIQGLYCMKCAKIADNAVRNRPGLFSIKEVG